MHSILVLLACSTIPMRSAFCLESFRKCSDLFAWINFSSFLVVMWDREGWLQSVSPPKPSSIYFKNQNGSSAHFLGKPRCPPSLVQLEVELLHIQSQNPIGGVSVFQLPAFGSEFGPRFPHRLRTDFIMGAAVSWKFIEEGRTYRSWVEIRFG